MTPTLQLTRAVLRPWTREDAPSLARHGNSRAIWRNLRDAFPHPYTLADAERWIDVALARVPQTFFAIVADGEACGGIGYSLHADVERVSAELGYWIGEAHQGKGIVTEAVRAVTAHAVATHGLTRVYATPYEWNLASCRVLEKAGYVREARMRRAAIKDGQIIDQYLYAWVVPA